jgi:hypothetical protein
MFNSRQKKTSIYLVLVIGLVGAAGCNRGPGMAVVKGKVTYTDGSIPGGNFKMVRFQPADTSTAEIRKGATGDIQADGTFELTTRMPGDGVFLGEYVVTFAIQDGITSSRPYVAPKFTNPKTSPYKVLIEDDTTDLEFKVDPMPGAPRAAG